MNWRAKPLVSYRVIVDLISATTTETGLRVHCELDTNAYPKGIVISDEDMAAINIGRARHGRLKIARAYGRVPEVPARPMG